MVLQEEPAGRLPTARLVFDEELEWQQGEDVGGHDDQVLAADAIAEGTEEHREGLGAKLACPVGDLERGGVRQHLDDLADLVAAGVQRRDGDSALGSEAAICGSIRITVEDPFS